jgi:CRP-like cAMP-binding protein
LTEEDGGVLVVFASSLESGNVSLMRLLLRWSSVSQVMADEFLGDGGYFGERALLMPVPRAANVIAQEPVRVFAVAVGRS